MRLALDARGLGPTETGVGRTTRLLLEALLEEAPPDSILDVLHQPGSNLHAHPSLNLIPCSIAPTAHPWTELWEATFLRTRLSKLGVELFHAPAFRAPWLWPMKRVVTVHNLAAWRTPETIPTKFRLYLRWAIRQSIRSATVVICPSEAVKLELEGLFPRRRARIEAIPWGAPHLPRLSPEEAQRRRARLGLPERYFLATGAGEPRKNHRTLFQALRAMASPIPLILTGGAMTAEDRNFVDRLDLNQYIFQAKYLDIEDLSSVVQGSVALVYPSLYEGFGLPILEAMSLSVPVLTSNLGAMAEVAGPAAMLVHPLDVEGLANGLERLASDQELRQTLIAQGRHRVGSYSWKNTARRHWQVYLDCKAERS